MVNVADSDKPSDPASLLNFRVTPLSVCLIYSLLLPARSLNILPPIFLVVISNKPSEAPMIVEYIKFFVFNFSPFSIFSASA